MFPVILAYFYSSDIFNAGLVLVTVILQCGISTFTQVKDLNTASTTDPVASQISVSPVKIWIRNIFLCHGCYCVFILYYMCVIVV